MRIKTIFFSTPRLTEDQELVTSTGYLRREKQYINDRTVLLRSDHFSNINKAMSNCSCGENIKYEDGNLIFGVVVSSHKYYKIVYWSECFREGFVICVQC